MLAELLGELADGRRLAGAVHADDEDHGRLRGERERGRVAEEQLDLFCQRLAEVVQVAAGLEPPHDLGRRANADVAVDERLLEPLPGLLVAGVERSCRDLGGQRPAALRERVAQPAEEAGALRLVLRGRLVTEQLCPGSRHRRNATGEIALRYATACSRSCCGSRRETTCETPSPPIVTP